jgi:hypothetical protein
MPRYVERSRYFVGRGYAVRDRAYGYAPRSYARYAPMPYRGGERSYAVRGERR